MKVRVDISPLAVAALSVLFYWDPAGLFWPFLGACALHEAAHALCVFLCGGKITMLRLQLLGMQLQAQGLSSRTLLLSTIAGPASNLLLALLFLRTSTEFALCNLLLGIFNLLPILPLDGAQILLQLLGDGPLFRFLQTILLLLFCAVSLAAAIAGGGFLMLTLTGTLLLRACLEMAVAKRAKSG